MDNNVIQMSSRFFDKMMNSEYIYENRHLIAYYTGIMIVFITHLFMLSMPNMRAHAIINLIAALLIAYYFVDKEFNSNKEGKRKEKGSEEEKEKGSSDKKEEKEKGSEEEKEKGSSDKKEKEKGSEEEKEKGLSDKKEEKEKGSSDKKEEKEKGSEKEKEKGSSEKEKGSEKKEKSK